MHRTDRMPTTASLSELTVLDEHGGVVALPTLWAAGPSVLVFIRHFG